MSCPVIGSIRRIKVADTLYSRIFHELRAEIDEHRLLPGDRIPTERELCEKYEVSRITARRAVQELERRHYVYRVKGKGSYVRVPGIWSDIVPYQASGQATTLLSVILPHQESNSFELLRGIESEAKRNGYYVSFHNSSPSPEHEAEIVEEFVRSKRTSGLIVYPSTSHTNLSSYSRLVIEGFPLVFVDRDVDGISVPLVQAANRSGMYEMVEHLIGLGHRRIGFASSDMNRIKPVFERYLGYCAALIDAGISVQDDYVFDEATLRTAAEGDSDEVDGAALQYRFFEAATPRPTAVVFENDFLASAFLKHAIAEGISIPDELSITGFDNLSIAEHLTVPLTTVEQSFSVIGAKACRMLISIIEKDRTGSRNFQKHQKRERQIHQVPTRLVLRQSTAPPKHSTNERKEMQRE